MKDMFCFQCQQTAHNARAKGKRVYAAKKPIPQITRTSLSARLSGFQEPPKNGNVTEKTDTLVLKGLFTTITNVNFNDTTIKKLKSDIEAEKGRINSGKFEDYDMKKLWEEHEDIRSLKSLILFGIKGMAAYAYHALALGKTDSEVNKFFYEALFAIGENKSADELLALVLKTGEVNFKCMALLDEANTESYGNPVPTEVPLTIEKGPFIVVSGHDLHDSKAAFGANKGQRHKYIYSQRNAAGARIPGA